MPTPEEILDDALASPAAAAVDGQSATARSAADLLALLDRKAAADALAGTNANGGPVSGWAKLRTARAIPPGAT